MLPSFVKIAWFFRKATFLVSFVVSLILYICSEFLSCMVCGRNIGMQIDILGKEFS